jgi:hypothetical protein
MSTEHLEPRLLLVVVVQSLETAMAGSFEVPAVFPQVKDAEGSELLACKQGLTLSCEAQARKIVLETDSAAVASKLRSEGQDRSVYGSLVEDLKTLLRGF